MASAVSTVPVRTPAVDGNRMASVASMAQETMREVVGSLMGWADILEQAVMQVATANLMVLED